MENLAPDPQTSSGEKRCKYEAEPGGNFDTRGRDSENEYECSVCSDYKSTFKTDMEKHLKSVHGYTDMQTLEHFG